MAEPSVLDAHSAAALARLALYNPIRRWSKRAEYNVLQPRSVAALRWAVFIVLQPPSAAALQWTVGSLFFNTPLQWAEWNDTDIQLANTLRQYHPYGIMLAGDCPLHSETQDMLIYFDLRGLTK